MLRNESILKVHYRIDGQALYRFHASAVERIVPWGTDADAWRMAAGAWQPFIPEIDVSSVEEKAGLSRGLRSPPWQGRAAACRFLTDRWPDEARDGVRGFPSAHWQLLQFVNTGGAPALELLRSNPALGYLAALAGVPSQASLRRRSLAALCGFPETEHAVRLLRKVRIEWISTEVLAQLRAAMTNERDADAVLTHLTRINPIALEVARDPTLRASVAAACLERLSRVPATVPHCDLVGRMRDSIERARVQALRPRPIRSLSDLDRFANGAREQAPPIPPPIRVRLDDDWLVRPAQRPAPPALPRPTRRGGPLAFPAPPLPGLAAPGIRICAISSHPDLVTEGQMMEHCAGREKSYARRVASGGLYFYRMLEPERLTIAIRPGWRGWVVEAVRGFCNREPLHSSSMLILYWLRQCGELSSETTHGDPAPDARPFPAVVRPAARPRRRFTSANQLSFDFRRCEAPA